jgi:hypothetical protein
VIKFQDGKIQECRVAVEYKMVYTGSMSFLQAGLVCRQYKNGRTGEGRGKDWKKEKKKRKAVDKNGGSMIYSLSPSHKTTTACYLIEKGRKERTSKVSGLRETAGSGELKGKPAGRKSPAQFL